MKGMCKNCREQERCVKHYLKNGELMCANAEAYVNQDYVARQEPLLSETVEGVADAEGAIMSDAVIRADKQAKYRRLIDKVMKLHRQGHSNREVARRLRIAHSTVNKWISNAVYSEE